MTEGLRLKARISGVATYLPERTLTSGEVEQRIEGYVPHPGIVERLTGIRQRHVARDDQQASDLAAEAARELDLDGVDLLIFASASQDMIEPATAHIVSAKLGLSCPVFDVKNACNSILNGIQVAEALIRTGAYAKVLVCGGEVPSRAIRWRIRDRAQFVDAFAGYTLSDAGAAVLVTADPHRGIFYRDFSADSTAWAVGTLPGGGTAHPRDPEFSYFRGDGRRLREAFELVGPDLFLNALKRTGLSWDDFAVVAVHQVAMPYLHFLAGALGIPDDRLVVTLPEHGNCASATLPLQLAQGGWSPGDRVALLGLAGGISLGVMLAEM
ncbi:3-oxoacyl-[acyl-carrier-protein] synthase-3 [Thermocatellispora tengchongensis]|uniref:3-oxoacyl-[acyl-carrier-protein] synthase-3 n=1 Tax=Thermocatellispora tengchongensis TaxID=1073253 RepID=A0A840NZE1_9ACTN|nr:ketoacyl-ACP synthase III [Thermocatellispora tengchongensis]MBB5130377.1 3-oxoacyl-[acyl-carrier-protein] synthase-3 [Thermocatellispora tengchongensis]